MLFEKIILGNKRPLILVLMSYLLVACSSNQVNQPKELDLKFQDLISLERIWKKSVGAGDDGLKLQLTPILKDNRIYSVDVEGYLTAIDLGNGKQVWEHDIGERVSGGLAIDGRAIYLTTFKGFLISLDLATGKENWRTTVTSEVIAPPALNGELVIVQTIDGKIQAFDLMNGRPRWRYDSVAPILSLRGTAEPLVSRKYTLSSFANGELVMLDNDSGRPLWKTELALPKGRTELERLVDSDGQPILDGDTIFAGAYQGKVFALSAIDGQEKWSKEVSSFNKLAIGFGKVFVTTDIGEIVALDKLSGKELWRNDDFLYRRLGPPMVFDQYVMAADLEGFIHVLSVLDGEVLARKQPDSEGVMGDIIVKGDRLYVYARSGDIVSYQLNPENRKKFFGGSRFIRKKHDKEIYFPYRD